VWRDARLQLAINEARPMLGSSFTGYVSHASDLSEVPWVDPGKLLKDTNAIKPNMPMTEITMITVSAWRVLIPRKCREEAFGS
jgi:hypothetical protein